MIIRNVARTLAGVTLVAALAGAGAAAAQAPAAAARPAAAPLGGPVIAGVCVLDNQRMVQQSAVGKAVIARMQQLAQQVSGELNPQRTALQTEGQTLTNQKVASTDPRVAAYRTKAETYARTEAIRERELQMTQQKALARIGTEADPVVRQIYAQKNCGLLLDRSGVFGSNPAMDITDQVIAGLNARITQFTFERERMPQQAAAPAAR